MGGVAHVTVNFFIVHCVGAPIVDRRPCSAVWAILRAHLSPYVLMEYTGYLVGMECEPAGGIGRFFCQQPADVYTVVAVQAY